MYGLHLCVLRVKCYLCASFRILGVPSNRVERLSGATIKTLAILQKKSSSLHSCSKIKMGRNGNIAISRKLTCPAIQIFHQQKEHWNCAQILHIQLCHASAVVLHWERETNQTHHLMWTFIWTNLAGHKTWESPFTWDWMWTSANVLAALYASDFPGKHSTS